MTTTKKVTVNDTVLFSIDSSVSHDVKLTSSLCTFNPSTDKTIVGLTTSGSGEYNATTPGTYYFGCDVIGHCTLGVKLTLTVCQNETSCGDGSSGASDIIKVSYGLALVMVLLVSSVLISF